MASFVGTFTIQILKEKNHRATINVNMVLLIFTFFVGDKNQSPN